MPRRFCIEPHMQKRLAITASLALTLLFAGSANIRAQQITAVPKLDENTLVGVWYQVAQIPSKRDTKRCMSDILEVIAPGEKHQVQVVDSCTSPKGYTDSTNRTYKRDKALDGKLKSGIIFPLSTKHWILAQSPQNEWFLAGTPNHKSLWIYSKTSTLPPDVLMQIEAQAAAQGFPVTKLVPVTQ
jgi:apolipoprotein D and lipocalin family protein